MDIKAKITELVEKISKDKALQEQFQKDPMKAVESLLGVKLPADVEEQIVAGVKAKLTSDQLSGAANALRGLFGGGK